MNDNNSAYLFDLQKKMSLSKNELDQLLSNRKNLNYEINETIIKQGSDATHVYIVKEGLVAIFLEEENRKRIIHLADEFCFAMLPMINLYDTYPFSLKALIPSKICQINKSLFYNIIEKNPAAIRYISTWYNDHIITLYKLIKICSAHNTPGKIANIIWSFQSKPNILKYLNKEIIAQMAGINIESAGKILADFKKNNIISMNGEGIKIINIEFLNKICKIG